MKKRVKRKGRRSVIEKNTAGFNKEFRSEPRRGLEKGTENHPSHRRQHECLARRAVEARKKEELENSALLTLCGYWREEK